MPALRRSVPGGKRSFLADARSVEPKAKAAIQGTSRLIQAYAAGSGG